MTIKEHLNEEELVSYNRIIEYLNLMKPVFPKKFMSDSLKNRSFPDDSICKVSQAMGERLPVNVAIELMYWSKAFGIIGLLSVGRKYESYMNKVNRKHPDTEYYYFTEMIDIDDLLDKCLLHGAAKGEIIAFIKTIKRTLTFKW